MSTNGVAFVMIGRVSMLYWSVGRGRGVEIDWGMEAAFFSPLSTQIGERKTVI